MNDNEQIGSVPQGAPPQSPLQPVNNIPEETPPPPSISQDTPTPTVIIPASTPSDVSPWFYALFVLTLLLFAGVTTLLVLSLFQKKSSGFVPNQQVSPTKTAPTPTENPRSKSDELDDIEADITLIDFSELGKKVTDLESQATISASL